MRKPNKTPRAAYCTGCGRLFPKMHQLRDHRHTFRCGGLFKDVVEPIPVPETKFVYEEAQSYIGKLKRSVKIYPIYRWVEELGRWGWR